MIVRPHGDSFMFSLLDEDFEEKCLLLKSSCFALLFLVGYTQFLRGIHKSGGPNRLGLSLSLTCVCCELNCDDLVIVK